MKSEERQKENRQRQRKVKVVSASTQKEWKLDMASFIFSKAYKAKWFLAFDTRKRAPFFFFFFVRLMEVKKFTRVIQARIFFSNRVCGEPDSFEDRKSDRDRDNTRM